MIHAGFSLCFLSLRTLIYAHGQVNEHKQILYLISWLIKTLFPNMSWVWSSWVFNRMHWRNVTHNVASCFVHSSIRHKAAANTLIQIFLTLSGSGCLKAVSQLLLIRSTWKCFCSRIWKCDLFSPQSSLCWSECYTTRRRDWQVQVYSSPPQRRGAVPREVRLLFPDQPEHNL